MLQGHIAKLEFRFASAAEQYTQREQETDRFMTQSTDAYVERLSWIDHWIERMQIGVTNF
jgi:hypothetical protein